MMKNIPREWRIHGVFEEGDIAGVLPRGGLHFLASPMGNDRDAFMAELAVATASDAVVCGLGPADKNGARASLSGFFGLDSGAACGVAILTSREKADSLSRAVAANALARGISKPIPVAILGTQHIVSSHARLNELEAWFRDEYGVALGLLILDAELTQRELLSFQRQGRAVLAVCEDAPTVLPQESVVIVAGKGVMTVARPAQGAPWARSFDLESVTVGDAESLVLKPGEAAPVAAILKPAPPVARAPAAKKPEPKITSKVAVIRARGELSPEMRARWAEQGFVIVENSDDALPKPGEIKAGERRLIQVDGIDQNHVDLISVANKLRWKAIERGVSNDVVILPAA